MKAPPAVQFEYRVSRVLTAVVVGVALLALAALWASGLAHWTRAVLSALVAGYAGVTLGHWLRPRVRAVVWRGEGGLNLTLNDTLTDGRREAEGALSAARVLGPLIVLTVRWPPREREHLWILPDNLDADARRRLRMRLASEGHLGLASESADSH